MKLTKKQETESAATEKTKSENLQLREALQQVTSELEAKKRELEIEASLEKVRVRTMAMNKSDELTDVATLLFKQVNDLGIKTWTTGFNMWSDDENFYTDYITSPWGGFIEPYTIDARQFPIFKEVSDAKKSGKKFLVRLEEGEMLQETYRQLSKFGEQQFKQMQEGGFQLPSRQVEHFVFGARVSLMFITYELAPEAHDIFQRFGNVFEQTFTRFLDLKNAEAQARESQIQLALEKVRARTMAMHKSAELSDVIMVVSQQLLQVGLRFDNVSFGINDEGSDANFWMAAKGQPLPLLIRVPYINNPTLDRVKDAQKNGPDFFADILTKEENREWLLHVFSNFDGLTSSEETKAYLLNSPGYGRSTAVLKDIFITIGNYSAVAYSDEENNIFRRFARVFEQSYTRFLDLKKAEAQALQAAQDLVEIKKARQKAENALVELQATQKQLIQSEKMASLGELTAGIAHEIQNPLNFVNNFSELNTELVDELKAELTAGNLQSAIEIAGSIQDNEQKINHHGKRADAIVKGMLQHSRTGSGQKEPTDINQLADEYLRLAYHGLRARDKTFNAKFETSFDDSIGKINIIPQEIGRVILNLVNNAFYTVTEKKKQLAEGFEPTVTVTTAKQNDRVEIKVKDNGYGIPAKNLDKIFQPFFTTKPTGQGTGLGLSLAYDIITKGHHGELKVNTTEGDGTEFTIQLQNI